MTARNPPWSTAVPRIFTANQDTIVNQYIWIFPVLFIFHDMEEVIGMKKFMERNREEIIRRYPFTQRILAIYRKGTSTEAFALGVYEEFLVLIAICALVELTGAEWAMGIWFGGLVGFTVHLVIHLLQAIAIRKYIPAIITSILALPPSVLLVKHTAWDMSLMAVIGAIIGIGGIVVNLILAHKLMQWYDRKNNSD